MQGRDRSATDGGPATDGIVDTNRWNRIRYTMLAPGYDMVAGFSAQRSRSIFLLHPVPGDSVLVMGAGTGADLPHLPHGVRITAVDLTPAMLSRLEKRAAALGRRVDARVMDAQNLDFPDASFDHVVLHLILAVVPDPVAAFHEAVRVLRPGGRIVVFDKFVRDEEEPSWRRRALNVVSRVVATDVTRKLGPMIRNEPVTVEHEEDAMLGGMFRITLLRKDGK